MDGYWAERLDVYIDGGPPIFSGRWNCCYKGTDFCGSQNRPSDYQSINCYNPVLTFFNLITFYLDAP